MGTRRLVVVGGEIDGVMAAEKAARENPELDIKILLPGKFFSLKGYLSSYFIQNPDKDIYSFMSRIRDRLKEQYNVEILPCRKVTDIVSLEKKVVFENLLEGYQSSLEFDKLIIATGAKTVIPPVEGIEAGNVFFLDTLDDICSIREGIDAGLFKKAVVIGTTLAGINAANSLWSRGIEITMVEREEQIVDGFDVEIADLVRKQMEQKGVEILVNEKVLSLICNAREQVVEVHTPNYILTTDMVIWMEDVKPDIDVAKKAGVVIGKAGAIEVDQYMETNIPDIYAIGNCVERISKITGNPSWEYNMFVDKRAVQVLGYNVAHDNGLALSKGITGAASIQAFDLNISKAGLSSVQAEQQGYGAETAVACVSDSKHGYGDGFQENVIKLVVNKTDQKILGVQCLGGILSEKVLDVIATVISMGGTVNDLSRLDLVDHLPYITDMHPVCLVTDMITEKLAGKFQGISAYELCEILDDPQVVVLDVRTRSETAMGMLPGAINIPLNELEERIDQLDKRKRIVLVSKRGRRAYIGYMKLKQLGFEDLKVLDGGLSAYPY